MTDSSIPRNDAQFRTIGSNAVWNLLRYGSGWIALLFIPPLLVRYMEPVSYATWLILLQFGSYVSFFDNGMQTTIARYVGVALGIREESYLKKVLASTLIMLLVGAVGIVLVGLLGAAALHKIFPNIPSELLGDSRTALIVIALSLALALPFTTLVGGFLGLQRNRIVTSSVVAGKFISALGMAWSAFHHPTVISLAIWFAVGALLPTILYVLEWLKRPGDLPIHPMHGSFSLAREISAFYAVLAANTMAFILISGMDIPIVAHYDFSAVRFYSLATVFGNMLLIPQGAIVGTVMPAAASMSADRTAQDMGRALHKFVRFASMSMTILACGLALSAPAFLRIWLGREVGPKVLPYALALLAAQCITLTAHPYRTLVLAIGKQSQLLPAQFLEALANFAISITLVHYMGAMGVAVGTLIGSVAALVGQYTISMPRVPEIAMRRKLYLKSSLIHPALACTPALILLILLWRQHWNIVASIAYSIIGTALSGLILWSYTLSDEERDSVVHAIKQRIGR